MGKKRLTAEQRDLPHAFRLGLGGIEKPEAVLDVCLRSLRKQFAQPALGFKSAARSARVTRYSLSGPGQQKGTAREGYTILRLCSTTEEIYWAGITVNFQFLDTSHQLVDAGIIIFKGDVFDENKVPVLRAEWHCSDDQMRAIHAQPHWHAYHPPAQTLGPEFSAGAPSIFASGGRVDEEVDHAGAIDALSLRHVCRVATRRAECTHWRDYERDSIRGLAQRVPVLHCRPAKLSKKCGAAAPLTRRPAPCLSSP